ncbi:MAG: peroxidase [Chloroflexi bacterium]|nr:peroxidase [Chloroflexota bacterium]|tara:strand:+ start:4199 stop:4474 length:276 start_codon:yes stop_codon:yes gene_type:complete
MHQYGQVDFDEQTLAIVEYVEKLTKTPSQITEADVVALRSVGLDDQQILSVVMITSMYAFMNRLADGLGVQLDEQKREFVETWSKNLSSSN